MLCGYVRTTSVLYPGESFVLGLFRIAARSEPSDG